MLTFEERVVVGINMDEIVAGFAVSRGRWAAGTVGQSTRFINEVKPYTIKSNKPSSLPSHRRRLCDGIIGEERKNMYAYFSFSIYALFSFFPTPFYIFYVNNENNETRFLVGRPERFKFNELAFTEFKYCRPTSFILNPRIRKAENQWDFISLVKS